MSTPLSLSFFAQPTLLAARQLIGARLVRILDGERISGMITETEAYIGQTDLGCHGKAGLTPRTRIMFGPPGHAYVYFTYGMHWMLNAVTEAEGFPAAVLIRGMRVEEGLELVRSRRPGISSALWTNGPAKLTRALGISGEQNGVELTDPASGLWIEPGIEIPDSNVTIGPRVGLNSVPEPWKSKPWRFLVTE